MKSEITQQEVLLLASTALSRSMLYTIEDAYAAPSSGTAKPETSCWNGLLKEVISEIFGRPPADKPFSVLNIRQGDSLLQISLAQMPVAMEKEFSIDPKFFLTHLLYN